MGRIAWRNRPGWGFPEGHYGAASRMNPLPAAVSMLRHLRPAVRAMSGYTPGEQVNQSVKLNTNECPWPPSPRVLSVLRELAEPGASDRLRLYPDPVSRRLRETAAGLYGVSPDQVLAGNGSDDCLTVLYRAFLDPGDRVAVPWPTYGLYDTLAALQGIEIVHVDFLRDAAGWHLPEALGRLGAKLVLVANPNNPSATLVPVATLRRLCEQVDGMVVVDEAYIDFALADGHDATLLPFIDQHPNLVVLRTFSKSYSLAGARLGLLFAAAPLVAELIKVKDSYNVNVLTQALGIAALEDRDHFRDCMRKTVDERRRLERLLAERFGWTCPPSAGNFCLFQVGPDAERLYLGLKQRGLLVRWWNRPILRECLRITVGRPDQTDALIAHLTDLAP